MTTPSSNGKRFRSSTACTVCRQVKIKCDRRDRHPSRCSRCEATNSVCETSATFERRRMKNNDSQETQKLRSELEQLKQQVASLIPGQVQQQQQILSESPQTSGFSPSGASVATRSTEGNSYVLQTLQRSLGTVVVQPWDIDMAFSTFFRDMHPFLPFLTEASPNSFFDREPFLFWTIVMLGARSVLPEISKSLAEHVKAEALQAPLRTCHKQAVATCVVQALLLLSLWPFSNPSLLHEASWIHCGTATHLAQHLGLHHPLSASEFVPHNGREHIPNLFCEFRRTWIAVYVINNLISYARGYPCTTRADYNIIEYTLSSAAELNISPDLFKSLLIARRIEEGQELGTSRTSKHGHIDPASREGIYRLLRSRLSETEKQVSPLPPSMKMMFIAAQLQCQVQVLQSTSPIHLQETTILTAFETATQAISLARQIQHTTVSAQLPVFLDALLLMSTVLIFKISISRFSGLVNAEISQHNIAEACAFCQETVNDFNDIPARVSIFLNALYALVVENQIPVGGFIIENTKCRNSQNILYEVLWIFKEWKRRRIEECSIQQTALNPLLNPISGSEDPLNGMLSFVDNAELDPGFWQMLGFESEMGL